MISDEYFLDSIDFMTTDTLNQAQKKIRQAISWRKKHKKVIDRYWSEVVDHPIKKVTGYERR